MKELRLKVKLQEEDYEEFEEYCKSLGCSMDDYVGFLIEYTARKSERVSYFKPFEKQKENF